MTQDVYIEMGMWYVFQLKYPLSEQADQGRLHCAQSPSGFQRLHKINKILGSPSTADPHQSHNGLNPSLRELYPNLNVSPPRFSFPLHQSRARLFPNRSNAFLYMSVVRAGVPKVEPDVSCGAIEFNSETSNLERDVLRRTLPSLRHFRPEYLLSGIRGT